MKLTTLLLTSVLAISLMAGHQALAGTLDATIVAGQTSITAGSPLLVELSVENKGLTGAALEQPLDEVYGTAIVQIKAPGRDQFVNIRTAYTSRKHLAGYEGTLLPGEKMAAYCLLFASLEDELVFALPGRYQLRAKLHVDEQDVVSGPIDIHVTAAAAATTSALKSVSSDWTHVSIHEALDDRRLGRLKTALGKDRAFANMLNLVEGISQLHLGPQSNRGKGIQRLEALASKGKGPWKELSNGLLARHHANTGNKVQAHQQIRQSQKRSHLIDQAVQVLQSR